jgi:hypothetical protein
MVDLRSQEVPEVFLRVLVVRYIGCLLRRCRPVCLVREIGAWVWGWKAGSHALR